MKLRLIFLLFLLHGMLLGVRAQVAPHIQWQKMFGGTNWDAANCIQQTRDSGFIVVGDAESSDGDFLSIYSPSNYGVVKLDSRGKVQWKKVFGGSGEDVASSCVQTFDGGYIIAGQSSSNDLDVGGDNHGLDDCWILKLDSSGQIVWKKSYGGSASDRGDCIQQTADSGYIICGSANSNDGDAKGHHGTTSNNDCWIFRLDPAGVVKWERSVGGSGNDEGYSVVQTADGGFIVAGMTNSTNGDAVGLHGSAKADAWIIKLNDSGSIEWKKTYGGTNTDEANCIVQTSDGGYIIVGVSYSTDGDVSPAPGRESECWVFKLDSVGEWKWGKTFGGSSQDIATWIQPIAGGRYVVACISYSTDGDVIGGDANGNEWIVCLDSVGNFVWQKSLGGTGTDWPNYIQGTYDKGYVVAGYSSSNDGDASGNHGQYDFWIVKLAFPSSIASIQQKNIPALLCNTTEFDTLYIHNTGSLPLRIDSTTFSTSNPAFTVRFPRPLPDSVFFGDSLQCIIGISAASVGTVSTTLNVFSNDTTHDPWPVLLTVRKDSVGVVVAGVSRDTLDFGYLSCGRSKDTSVALTNVSTIATTFAMHTTKSALFSVPPSMFLNTTVQQQVTVRFAGASIPQTCLDSLVITDTCDLTKTVYLKATVDSPAIAVAGVPDTTICPKDTAFRTVIVRNNSHISQLLQITGGAPLYSIGPTSVTVGAGGSTTLKIVFHGSPTNGVVSVNYSLVDDCGGKHDFVVRVDVEDAAVVAQSIPDTTLCPGDQLSRVIKIRNVTISTQQLVFSNTDPMYSIAPTSILLAPGDSGQLNISFKGTPKIGTYAVSYPLPSRCGGTSAITENIRVDTASVVTQAIPNITLCPGDSNTHKIWIRNISVLPQTFQLSGIGSGLFAVSPAAVSILPGDSAAVNVKFTGTPITGTYTVQYKLPGCGAGHSIVANVYVSVPNIVVPQSFSIAVCPFTDATIPIPISNADTVLHVLSYSAASSTLSKSGATLPAGGQDTLIATFTGAAAGSYQCLVHIVDECGIAHDVTVTIDVKNLPPLQLSPIAKVAPDSIGSEEKVYVVVSPASALSSDDITFTVTNEPTALKFSRASSPCFINVLGGRNTDTVIVSHCSSSGSDTIATLYYRSFEGATFAPWVNIPTVSTTTACQTISAIGQATIALYPPGCELGTLTQRQAANAIEPVYPNPVTGMATISYSICEDENVTLNVRDAMGRTLRTVLDALRTKGTYRVDMDTRGMQSGIYLVRMQTASAVVTREFIVLR